MMKEKTRKKEQRRKKKAKVKEVKMENTQAKPKGIRDNICWKRQVDSKSVAA